MVGELSFSGGAVSYGRNQTPFMREVLRETLGDANPDPINHDFALAIDGVGVFVADGVGAPGLSESGTCSRFVVETFAQLVIDNGLCGETDHNIFGYAVHRLLEQTDNKLAHRRYNGATTLAALLAGNGFLGAVGIGDSTVIGTNPATGQFEMLTTEQCLADGARLTNWLSGDGRYSPNQTAGDQVRILPARPSTRYVLATDGFTGDTPEQRIPLTEKDLPLHSQKTMNVQSLLEAASEPAAAVEALAALPSHLARTGARIRFGNQQAGIKYVPKHDDTSIAVAFIG